jgi:2-polyprenyl-6-methoxyphenol hydroxylase-like FAD-dependent oxidoreductase
MDVVIVGAGPAGAALAHLLASRGIEVALLERQLDFAREFRGEVLMPSGIEALEQVGLHDWREIPHSCPTSVEAFVNGRSFFREDVDPALFEGRPPVALSQPALLERLVADAGQFSTFHFERGATVRELVRERGRVVGVVARTREGERELRGRLVVGADGRSSVVRRESGLRPERKPQVMDVVWCKFPLPEAFGEAAPARAYLGRGHLLFAYRAPDGRLQVAWVIQKGTFGELRSRGVDEWIEAMAEHVSPDLSAHFRRHPKDVSKPFVLDAALDCVASWSAPGVLLLGDAAHIMSPVGGQGLNVALRDTLVAANHLVPAFASGAGDAALDAASRRIEAERLTEIVPIQRMQAMPPRLLLNRAWWAEPARRLIPLVARSRFARETAARGLSRFVFGVEPVKLAV